MIISLKVAASKNLDIKSLSHAFAMLLMCLQQSVIVQGTEIIDWTVC